MREETMFTPHSRQLEPSMDHHGWQNTLKEEEDRNECLFNV